MSDRYELYYWPSIPGRGEFVRLVLEEAEADWVDVAREQGPDAVVRMLRTSEAFAPPILRVGEIVLAQTPLICSFLGERFGLVKAEHVLQARQQQLTIADMVDEAHDTHHPIASSLYYEDQKEEAKRRAKSFVEARMPKYLSYFERALGDAPFSYVHLSMFQLLEGLEYAFPKAFARVTASTPKLLALRDAVAARPRIAAYLASPGRLAFSEKGLFRRYPELDDPT